MSDAVAQHTQPLHRLEQVGLLDAQRSASSRVHRLVKEVSCGHGNIARVLEDQFDQQAVFPRTVPQGAFHLQLRRDGCKEYSALNLRTPEPPREVQRISEQQVRERYVG